MRLKQSLRETGQIIRVNSGSILLFELVYRMLNLPLFFQMSEAMVRLAVQASGYSYVTVNNLWGFLGKPVTILVLAVMLVMLLLEVMLEIGCLVTAFQAAALSRKIHALAIFTGGISKTAAEIRRGNFKWFLVAAVHGCLIHLFFFYRLLCHVKPVKFILPGLLAEDWGRLLLAAVLVMFVVLSIPTAFTAFGCMVEQRSFRDSVKRSQDLLQGNGPQTVFILVLCNGLVILAGIVLYLAAVFLVAVLAVRFIDRRMELALLLAARDRIEFALIYAASIAAMVVNYGTLTVLYVRYCRKRGESVPWDPVLFEMETARRGRLLTRRNMLGILSLITAVSIAAVFDASRNGSGLADDILYEVQITAHRGSSASAPENTLAALEAAVDDLADFAEIDVQETADGKLVLFHDRTLKRITGENRSLAGMTWEEVSRIDAGAWFSEAFAGTAVPTLEEAIETARGRLRLNIEIKNMGASSDLPEKVAALLEEQDFIHQCVVTSTSLDYLRRVKEAVPELYTGYIASAAYGSYYQDEAVDFVSMLSSSVNGRLVEAVHECGKEIHVWTVNQKSELERMKLLGVDNVITDHPLLAREVLYAEKNTEHLLVRLREMLK